MWCISWSTVVPKSKPRTSTQPWPAGIIMPPPPFVPPETKRVAGRAPFPAGSTSMKRVFPSIVVACSCCTAALASFAALYVTSAEPLSLKLILTTFPTVDMWSISWPSVVPKSKPRTSTQQMPAGMPPPLTPPEMKGFVGRGPGAAESGLPPFPPVLKRFAGRSPSPFGSTSMKRLFPSIHVAESC